MKTPINVTYGVTYIKQDMYQEILSNGEYESLDDITDEVFNEFVVDRFISGVTDGYLNAQRPLDQSVTNTVTVTEGDNVRLKITQPPAPRFQKKWLEDIDKTHQQLLRHAEADADMDEILHEFEVLKSIVLNRTDPAEWLASLVEQYMEDEDDD